MKEQDDLFGPRGTPAADYAEFETRFLQRATHPVRGAREHLPARNAFLIDLFSDRETLTVGELFERVARTVDPSSGLVTAAVPLGATVAQAVHWKVLVPVKIAGSPAWRLPDRRPRFMTISRKVVQVRGLPPEEQAAMDRRLAAIDARRARADLRHAEEIAPRITACLTWLAQEGARIPRAWEDYVPAFVAERWPKIEDALGLLMDLHRGLPRQRQLRWLSVIEERLPSGVVADIRRGLSPIQPGHVDEILEEDLEALRGLGSP